MEFDSQGNLTSNRFVFIDSKYPEDSYVDAVLVKNKKIDGVFFPVDVQYYRYQSAEDNRISRQEHVSVEVVSLNQPIDPAVFSIKELDNVSEGDYVIWSSNSPPPVKGNLIWDGEQVTSERALFEASKSTNRSWMYIYFGLALVTMAALVVRRSFKS